MATLGSNSDLDLLSSQSVFVSPLAGVAIQAGSGDVAYPTADRYCHHVNDIGDHHGKDKAHRRNLGDGVHADIQDPQWRWAGPSSTTDQPTGRFQAKRESGLTYDVGPSKDERAQHELHDHAMENSTPTSHHRPDRPDNNDGFSRERHDDTGDDGGGYDSRGRLSTQGDDDGYWEGDSGRNHADPVDMVSEAAAAGTTSPLASRSFEDQPIRGLAAGKELSLDELIAQGERQMQESQARTALAKAPRSARQELRHSPRASAAVGVPATIDDFQGHGSAGARNNSPVCHSADKGRVNNTDSSGTAGVHTDHSNNDDDDDDRNRHKHDNLLLQSSTASGGASGRELRRGFGEIAAGVRVSTSTRSASFATSWSGGDPEQLGQLSMGVLPAGGGGDATGGLDKNARSERERQEFYELEMELLREEEREAGKVARLARHGGTVGGREGEDGAESHDDFWGDERESLYAGTEGDGTVRRESVTDGPGFETVPRPEPHRGHLGWGREGGYAHRSGAGRYQNFLDDAEEGVEIADEPQARRPEDRGRPRDHRDNRSIPRREPGYRDLEGEDCGTDGGVRRKFGDEGPPEIAMEARAGDAAVRPWEVETDGWYNSNADRKGDGTGQRQGKQGSANAHAMRGAVNSHARTVRRQPNDDDPAGEDVVSKQEHFQPVSPTPPPPPPPPPAPPHSRFPSGEGGASAADGFQQRSDSDMFDDDRAWGEVNSTGEEVAHATATAAARNLIYGRTDMKAGATSVSSVPERDARAIDRPPSQSKLVQKMFGARGRRGRGAGNRGGGRVGRGTGGRDVAGNEAGVLRQGDREMETGRWAVEAELQGKLRELEEEIVRYKEENERARLARRKQEVTLAEVMRKRQEVREWAEAERAAVEAWCSEQRQTAAREKRAALKQAQGLRARAQAGGGLAGGTATERRQRQEIEGLKATIERGKLDAEAARKKARAAERRLQQQIKAGAERVQELEGQVSFLERQRVEIWANATGGVFGGTEHALSRSGNAGTFRTAVGNGGASGSASGWRAGGQSRVRASSGLARAAEHRREKSWGVGALTKSREGARSLGQEDGDQARASSSRTGQDEGGPGATDTEFREHRGAGGRSEANVIFPEGRPARGGLDSGDSDDEIVESDDGADWRRGSGGEDRPTVGEWERDDPGHEARRHTTQIAGEQRWSHRSADGVRDGHSESARTGEQLQSEPSRTRDDAPWLRAQPDVLEADIHRRPTTPGGHRRQGSEYPATAKAGAPPRQQRDSAPGFEGTTTTSGDGSPPQAVDRQLHNGTVRPSGAAAAAAVADSPSPAVWIAPDQMGKGVTGETGGYEKGNPMVDREENSSNRWSESPWERPPASEVLQNDKYDPLRYKTTASGTQRGLDFVPPRDAVGGWTGAASTSAARVSWAEEGDRQSVRRSMPSRGKADTGGIRHRELPDGQGALIADGAPRLLPGGPEGNRHHNSADYYCSTDPPHQDWRTISQSDHRGAIEEDKEENATRQRLHRIAATELSEDTNTLARNGTVRRDHPNTSVDVAHHLEVSTHPEGHHYDEGGRARERAKRAAQVGVAVAAMSQRGGAEEGRASLQVGSREDGGGGGGGGGGKVEHVLRDGRRVILFANGTQKETLPDGGYVVRFVNGDLKRVEGGTGVVIYTYAEARTTHTMHPSGLEVFEFPNGQVERHHKTGEKDIDFPDGTRKTILPSGREISEFPDGVTVVEYPEGHRDVTSPDGTSHRELADGTMENLPAEYVLS